MRSRARIGTISNGADAVNSASMVGHAYIRRIGSAGMDTSIVAVRETAAPETTVDALDFVDHIRGAWRPASSVYADAPLLQDWRQHTIEIARTPALVLIGTVTGHPEFPRRHADSRFRPDCSPAGDMESRRQGKYRSLVGRRAGKAHLPSHLPI